MKKNILLLVIFSNLFSFGQNKLIQKFNDALKENDIYSLHKYFKYELTFNEFKFLVEQKHIKKSSFIENKTESNNERLYSEWQLIKDSSNSKIELFDVFIENVNSNPTVCYINIQTGTIKNVKQNFLNNNISIPYITNDSMRLHSFDSLTNQVIILFKENKNEFIKTYYNPDYTDQSIGDSWAMRESLKQNNIINLQYQNSFFDKKINRGAITVLLTFSDNSQEYGVLYFKILKNKLTYFYTDSEFKLEKFLK